MANPDDIEKRLDRLDKIISTGTSSTKHGDEQINFRSYDELRRIKADIQEEQALAGRKRRKRAFTFRGGKGF